MTHRIALSLLGLLSVADIATLAATDGEHPPYAIAALGAVLGALSLWLVVRAWRGNRRVVPALIGLRLLSAATAVPAFVVDDVPTPAVVAAAAILALTVVAVLLLARPVARTQVAA